MSAYSFDYARRTLIPAMGGSIAAADFDGDGRPDVLVIRPGDGAHLFRNSNDGFKEVTAKAGVETSDRSFSATFADYDHSGRLSLFVAGLGEVKVYRNRGNGTFSDETQKAGINCLPSVLYTHVAVGDLDQDGYPDLIVTAYSNFNASFSKATFVFPNDFSGTVTRVYRNNRNGTFTDMTSSTGLADNPGRARRAVIADFDGDGRQDLLILRDDKPPVFYLNEGNWKFKDFSWDADEQLSRNAFIDAQVSDFNKDSRLDLTLWSTLASRTLLNQGGGKFELVDTTSALTSFSEPFRFHGTVVDINDDGMDDLLALDSKGKWRLLLNRGGSFQEALFSLTLHDGSVARSIDSMIPLRLTNHGRQVLYFIALLSDGSVKVVKKQESVSH